MAAPVATHRASSLTRRTLLRAAGVSLALPWLQSLMPRRARAADAAPPLRMVCICTPLGLHAPNLFPQTPGKDYELTPYLEILKEGGGILSTVDKVRAASRRISR